MHKVTDRVLVTDDEPGVRLVLQDMLRTAETAYEVDQAADGVEALEKLKGADYSVLLADIVMPRMDGMALLDAVHSERPELPVIMITAVRDEESILRCLAKGAWDYILKPFDLRQVRAAVRRACAVGKHLGERPGDIEVVTGGPGCLELTAASEVEYLHRFRKFTEVLLGTRLSSSEREDIRLAVEELGRNAIEWGNRYEHAKRVRLAFCLYEDRICFEIEDEGEGFIPDSLPDPSVDPIGHIDRRRREGKRPGGYGIHIVRKIMDEVEFSEKGNAVVLTKYLA
jgi:CheY-like chemotaxis protein/anti-sigma regulatory factor (Ser/Thr protein kinase)